MNQKGHIWIWIVILVLIAVLGFVYFQPAKPKIVSNVQPVASPTATTSIINAEVLDSSQIQDWKTFKSSKSPLAPSLTIRYPKDWEVTESFEDDNPEGMRFIDIVKTNQTYDDYYDVAITYGLDISCRIDLNDPSRSVYKISTQYGGLFYQFLTAESAGSATVCQQNSENSFNELTPIGNINMRMPNNDRLKEMNTIIQNIQKL